MIDEKKIEEAADEHCSGTLVQDILRRASFKAGVNWFKENLWHDASEEPKLDKSILLELASNDYVVVKLRSKYDFSEYPYNKAYRWLYIEDLTKGGK